MSRWAAPLRSVRACALRAQGWRAGACCRRVCVCAHACSAYHPNAAQCVQAALWHSACARAVQACGCTCTRLHTLRHDTQHMRTISAAARWTAAQPRQGSSAWAGGQGVCILSVTGLASPLPRPTPAQHTACSHLHCPSHSRRPPTFKLRITPCAAGRPAANAVLRQDQRVQRDRAAAAGHGARCGDSTGASKRVGERQRGDGVTVTTVARAGRGSIAGGSQAWAHSSCCSSDDRLCRKPLPARRRRARPCTATARSPEARLLWLSPPALCVQPRLHKESCSSCTSTLRWLPRCCERRRRGTGRKAWHCQWQCGSKVREVRAALHRAARRW